MIPGRLALSLVLATLGNLRAEPLYLLLDGLPGESRNARHAGWMEVSSFLQGVERLSAPDAPTLQDVTLTKDVDRSSPLLLLRCADGGTIKQATFECVRPLGSDRLAYLKVRLGEVTIAAVAVQGSRVARPREKVSLRFARAAWTYLVFDARGRQLQDLTCSWDRATGTGTGALPAPDSDADGLPDDYERLYGLDPARDESDGDLDGDGVSNLEEFHAGTRPNSPDSVLRTTGLTLGNGRVQIRWNAVPGRAYRLLGATNLDQPFEFLRLTEPALTENAEAELTLDPTAVRQFFVVEPD